MKLINSIKKLLGTKPDDKSANAPAAVYFQTKKMFISVDGNVETRKFEGENDLIELSKTLQAMQVNFLLISANKMISSKVKNLLAESGIEIIIDEY